MSEASARWYARVEKAIQELHRVLQEQQRRAAAAQAILRMQSQTDAQKRQSALSERFFSAARVPASFTGWRALSFRPLLFVAIFELE